MSGGGITEHAIKELQKSDNAVFDTVNIVTMPKWYHNRVVMVGDAAWCLTLFSGMGSTTAMMGAKELSDALAAHNENLEKALRVYNKSLRWFIEKHRLYTLYKTQFVVPSNQFINKFRTMMIRFGASQIVKKERKAGKLLVPQYAV